MPDPGDTAAGDTKTTGNWNGAPGGATSTSNNGSTPSSSNNGGTGSPSSPSTSRTSESANKTETKTSTSQSTSNGSPAPSQNTPVTKSSTAATNGAPATKTVTAPGPTNYTPSTSAGSVKVADPSRSIPSTPGAPGKTDLYGGGTPTLTQVPNGTTAAQQAANLASKTTPDYQRSLTDAVSGVPGPQVPTADRSVAGMVNDPTNIAPSTETMASLRSAIGIGAPPPKTIVDRVPSFDPPQTQPSAPAAPSYPQSQYAGYGTPDAPETQMANMQGLVNSGAITPTPVGDPVSNGTLVAGDPRVDMPPGSFQNTIDGPPVYESDGPTFSPSQDASAPQNLADLSNRAQYTYDNARQGARNLPSALYNAIVGGNITTGQDLHGLQQARGGGGGIEPFPTQNEQVNPDLLAQFMQQLKRRGMSSNQQLQLIMQTFI